MIGHWEIPTSGRSVFSVPDQAAKPKQATGYTRPVFPGEIILEDDLFFDDDIGDWVKIACYDGPIHLAGQVYDGSIRINRRFEEFEHENTERGTT